MIRFEFVEESIFSFFLFFERALISIFVMIFSLHTSNLLFLAIFFDFQQNPFSFALETLFKIQLKVKAV